MKNLIVYSIFSRSYIEAKLHTDLKTELVKLFFSLVADKNVAPATMASLCKHLATINPAFRAILPIVFYQYFLRAVFSARK